MTDIGQVARVELEAWMTLEDPAMTIDQAVAELTAAGNRILEIDPAGRRFLVAHVVIEDP